MSENKDWVALSPRFTPGWPWPEDSYGLGPMYGDDGWCRGCGTPLREQAGPLVMQGSKFPVASVWMPNSLFDVVCVDADLAAQIGKGFGVALGEVHKPRHGDTGVRQILPVQSSKSWYAPEDLSVAIVARHRAHDGDRTGASCGECKRWKWLPISEGEAPLRAEAVESDASVIASPEFFGDGLSSFRHLLFRRDLADVLVSSAKRNWDICEVTYA